jgi:hypothetical protein
MKWITISAICIGIMGVILGVALYIKAHQKDLLSTLPNESEIQAMDCQTLNANASVLLAILLHFGGADVDLTKKTPDYIINLQKITIVEGKILATARARKCPGY